MSPSPFDALAARLNGAVNGLRGEGFTLVPMAKADVNGRPAPDGTRAEVAFTATFDDQGNRAGSGVEDWRAANIRKDKPGHTTDRPEVHAERSLFTERPRKGDHLRRTATGDVFEIGEIVQDGSLFIFQLHK